MAEISSRRSRLIFRMKKILLLSAVLLGTSVASQAGVHLDIGIGFLFPAPVIVQPAPACASPPVFVEPHYCEPPQVVYVPPPVIYVPQRYYYSRPPYYAGRSDWNHGRSGWNGHGDSHRR